jgi:sodium transport system ATP-binding protein
MISVSGLSKTYKDKRKRIVALDDVSFECLPGQIFGLLGPNGAGKTTTLRIISTAIRPTAGGGKVLDFDLVSQSAEVRRRIGFLSTNTGLYGRLTAREVLTYFGRLYGIDAEQLGRRIDALSEMFQMRDFLKRPCDKLSTGMRQKVNIARTVIHEPAVLVLDEPTTGLDVLASRTIAQFVRNCRDENKTVLLSTHIMPEVEKLCDRVGIIHEGKLRFCGTVPEIRKKFGDDLDEAFVRIIDGDAK